MTSAELSLTNGRVNVNLEDETVIITGFDLDEFIQSQALKDVLEALDYNDVVEWVSEQEKEKREYEDEMRHPDDGR